MASQYELQPAEVALMVTCNQCGQHSFRLYAHKETGEVLSKQAGECSRSVCGYRYGVKKYLKENPQIENITSNE